MFDNFTDEARAVLEQAKLEARDAGHDSVGSEHLLLGILRDPDCVASSVLAEFGVDLAVARSVVISVLGDDVRPDILLGGEDSITPPDDPGRPSNQIEIHFPAVEDEEMLQPFLRRLAARFGRVFCQVGSFPGQDRQWWFYADDRDAAVTFLRVFRADFEKALGVDNVAILVREVTLL